MAAARRQSMPLLRIVRGDETDPPGVAGAALGVGLGVEKDDVQK